MLYISHFILKSNFFEYHTNSIFLTKVLTSIQITLYVDRKVQIKKRHASHIIDRPNLTPEIATTTFHWKTQLVRWTRRVKEELEADITACRFFHSFFRRRAAAWREPRSASREMLLPSQAKRNPVHKTRRSS